MKRPALALLLLASCTPAATRVDLDPLLAAADAKRIDDPFLVEATASSNPALRAGAATAYGRILTPACVDRLFALAGDADASVRRSAAFALGQYGWKSEFSGRREADILGRLDPLLSDPDKGVRLAAIEAAGKVGQDQVPAVVGPKLLDADADIRAEAILALFRGRFVQKLRTGDPKTAWPVTPQNIVDRLREMDADPSERVRRNVAFYFTRGKDIRGLESAVRLAKDKSAETRFFAMTAIARCGEASAVDSALAGAADPEAVVRLAAVQALAAMKRVGDLPAGLATDSSFHVRVALADAVGGSDGDDKVLDALLDDGSVTVRCAALKAAAKRRKEWAAGPIEKARRHADWRIRAAALEALGTYEGWNPAEAMLVEALADVDERVRATAVEVLGTRETPGAWEAVKTALRSTLVAVRSTAVEALKGRKESDALAEARSCYERSSDRKWVELREGIVDVFAAKEGEESSVALHKALGDPAPSVADKARRALEARGVKNLPAVATPPPAESPYLKDRFKRNPVVVLETTQGAMEVECLAADAPVHVANFVGLAKKGFYDGLLWHRVVSGFVIQGGDPLGNGSGDPGWSLRAEINPVRYERGSLGMPRSDHFDTGGCQLFFTHLATPHLDGNYTVFGRVTKGLEVIDRIEVGDTILKATVRE